MNADPDFSPVPFDRTPPFSLEAETAVLGGILVDNHALTIVAEFVSEKMFYREANRRVFRAMMRLFERGASIDSITLADSLNATGEFESAGGYDYLAQLVDAVPSASNIQWHSKIVRDKSIMRQAVEGATAIIRTVYDCDDPGEVLAAIDKLQEVEFSVGAGFKVLKHSLWSTFEGIERQQEADGAPTGIPSGFGIIDRATCGFQNSDLILVAARPSMGKTSWVMQCLLHASIEEDVPTAIISLEMASEKLIERAICQLGHVDMQKLRRGKLSPEEHQRMAVAAGWLNTAPIYLDDHPVAYMSEIRAKIRRVVRTEGVKMVAIDYLQLMNARGHDNRVQEIGAISRGLKLLARELDIPIIALSQLSRMTESRKDRRPMLSDLRDSGSLEQDADMVIFIHRPGQYMRDEAEQRKKDVFGLAEMIIAKQRNGPTGTRSLLWDAPSVRFYEKDDKPKSNWAI